MQDQNYLYLLIQSVWVSGCIYYMPGYLVTLIVALCYHYSIIMALGLSHETFELEKLLVPVSTQTTSSFLLAGL